VGEKALWLARLLKVVKVVKAMGNHDGTAMWHVPLSIPISTAT
jgi:hypothetical protein